jgi:hypothetical protein
MGRKHMMIGLGIVALAAGAALLQARAQGIEDEEEGGRCFRWKIVEFLPNGMVTCKCSCSPLAPYCCS